MQLIHPSTIRNLEVVISICTGRFFRNSRKGTLDHSIGQNPKQVPKVALLPDRSWVSRRTSCDSRRTAQRESWLGWWDSNLRYSLPKSVALPTQRTTESVSTNPKRGVISVSVSNWHCKLTKRADQQAYAPNLHSYGLMTVI